MDYFDLHFDPRSELHELEQELVKRPVAAHRRVPDELESKRASGAKYLYPKSGVATLHSGALCNHVQLVVQITRPTTYQCDAPVCKCLRTSSKAS